MSIFIFQVDIDFEKEPIGTGKDGKSIYFKDIWPSTEEIAQVDTRIPSHGFSNYYILITNSPQYSHNSKQLWILSPVSTSIFCRLCNPVCCLKCSRVHTRQLRKVTLCGTSWRSQPQHYIHGIQILRTFMNHLILRTWLWLHLVLMGWRMHIVY